MLLNRGNVTEKNNKKNYLNIYIYIQLKIMDKIFRNNLLTVKIHFEIFEIISFKNPK